MKWSLVSPKIIIADEIKLSSCVLSYFIYRKGVRKEDSERERIFSWVLIAEQALIVVCVSFSKLTQ